MTKHLDPRPSTRDRKRDPLLIKIAAVPSSQSNTGMMRRGYSFDLTALRDGRRKSGRGPAFSGRPRLAAEIGAAVQEYAEIHSPPPGTLEWMRAACSHLWLSLDDYEKRNPGCDRIESIDQLAGEVWISFCLALSQLAQNHAHHVYSCMKKILRRAEPDIHFAAQPFPKTPTVVRRETTDPYTVETMEEIKKAFRKDRYALLARFENANALADQGDPPATTLERYHRKSEPFAEVWTPANTLRFVRDLLLPTMPNMQTIRERYGVWTIQIGIAPDAPVPVPVAGQPTRERAFANCAGLIGLYRHFVPSYRDLVPIAAEAIAMEGLNPQCVMDYDREKCVRHSSDPNLVALHSRKSRARGKAIESISGKEPDSLSDIVTTAIRVTEPLRASIEAEVDLLRVEGKSADAERIHHLEFLQNRVWLTLKAKDVGVGWLRQDTDFRRAANEVLTRHGVKENGFQVRWDSRRLRDRKADDVFSAEKSLEQVRVALNQSCLNMPELYVTTPGRTHSDNDFLRQRFEKLAAFEDWPKLPPKPSAISNSIELIVTAQGREWLAARRTANSATKGTVR
jgi:hypothetical protein